MQWNHCEQKQLILFAREPHQKHLIFICGDHGFPTGTELSRLPLPPSLSHWTKTNYVVLTKTWSFLSTCLSEDIGQNFCKYYMKILPYLIRLHEIHIILYYFCLSIVGFLPPSLCTWHNFMIINHCNVSYTMQPESGKCIIIIIAIIM